MLNKDKLKFSPIAAAVRSSIFCLGFAHSVSHAATIVVDSNSDDGDLGCELREAVNAINIGFNTEGCINTNTSLPFGAGDTIIINPNALVSDTITLSGSQIQINKSVFIQGFNGLTIDGDQQSRVVRINESNVSLNSLTITNGSAFRGGGIYIDNSTVLINDCVLINNYASGGGGGIGDKIGENSTLTILNSTISENYSGSIGGGISVPSRDGANLNISSSTISRNTSIRRGGGVYSQANTFITNSTISANVSRDGGGIFVIEEPVTILNSSLINNTATEEGGGIWTAADSISLRNSIIAGTQSNDCQRFSGQIETDSATIIQDGSCNTQRAIDPQLGPLADNGGTTLTHALLPTSPARNSGVLVGCEIEDQRGQIRDDGDNACDVGAIEFNPNDVFDDTNFIVIPLANGKAVVIPN